MPPTLEDMDVGTIPMRQVYERNGVNSDMVAQARKEALSALIERTVKMSGVILDRQDLPSNLVEVASGSMETIFVHRTVDHRTRLQAAEAISEEMGLKPSKKVDLTMGASGLLAEILKEIDGKTLGIPSSQKEMDVE